ncbi:MAG: tyrosine-type recombinase/integrase [Atopobiaceae bacterium]|nr:tyrosine-type recombinase/integrase [Atopobiaceae bacterium]
MDAEVAKKRYLDFLTKNGNSENVRRAYCKRVEAFLEKHPEALEASEVELRSLCDEYVKEVPFSRSTEVVAAAVRYFWTMRFGKPYFKRVLLSSFPDDPAIDAEIEGYERFLRKFDMAETTVTARTTAVKRFLLTCFPDGTFSRDGVRADVVRGYVSEHMEGAAASSRSLFVTQVRSYARYLMSEGCETASDIALLPLKAPSPRNDIGPVISEEELGTMLAATADEAPKDLRDRAMLLLMGNLGLRASDVARLTLDDVDWDNGRLHVRHSKSKTERTLPLDADAGEALEHYVVGWRASVDGTRGLFLTIIERRPHEPMSSSQVLRAMRDLAARAGVSSYRGTHTLRRAAATNMVKGGASIKVVADVLGHEDASTTMRYLGLDVETLRGACSPWPGGGAS